MTSSNQETAMNAPTEQCPVTRLTTDFGALVVSNRDSLTAGPLLAQGTTAAGRCKN